MKYLIVICLLLISCANLDSKPVWNLYLDTEYANSAIVSSISRIINSAPNYCLALNLKYNWDARLMLSRDNGKSWSNIFDNSDHSDTSFAEYPPRCFNFYSIGENNLYLAFEQSKLFKSKDGGLKWDTVRFEPSNMNLHNIYMSDSLNGIICGQPWPSGAPHLLFTNDGWNSYKAIPRDSLPLELFLNYAYMEDKDTLMFISCVVGKSFVNWSFDKGNSWISDTLPEISAGNTYGKNFIKSPLGEYWLVGYLRNGIGDQSTDVIYKLDKIGGTWTKVYSGDLEPTFGLQEIAFGDSLNGVAVGQFGKILRTTDGGVTWFQEFLTYNGVKDKVDPPVMHVEYCGSTPLIGDFVGRIFRLEDDGTGDVEEVSYLSLYPNPASEFINIDEAMLNGSNDIEIYNALGVLVLDVSPAVSRINISVLSAGIYSLKCGDRVQSFVKY